VHDELMSAGWDANSSGYYAEIDRRVAAAFPAHWQEYMGLVRRGTWHQAPELPGPEAAGGGAAEGQEPLAGEADGQLHSGRVSRQSGVLGDGQEEGDHWHTTAAAASQRTGAAAPAKPAGAGKQQGPAAKRSTGAAAAAAAAAVGVPPLKIYASRAQQPKTPLAASTAQQRGQGQQPGGLMTPAVQAALPRPMQYRPAAIAPGGITDHIFGGLQQLGHPAAGHQQKQGGALAAGGRLATPLLLPSDTPSPPGGSPATSPQQYSITGVLYNAAAAGAAAGGSGGPHQQARPEFSVSAYQGQQAPGAGQQLVQSLRRGGLSELGPLELQVGRAPALDRLPRRLGLPFVAPQKAQ
jgi:hypothetical protein